MKLHEIPAQVVFHTLIRRDPQTTRFTFEWRSQTYGVTGEVERILPLGGVKIIEFVTRDSETNHPVFDEDSNQLFREALRDLVEHGVKFYTITRGDWALPFLHWRLG